ncbi:hypothetical protein [Pseudophaeobacter leonis]|nr:hypothetical protein [Pseudophaeobacter leonis]
MSDQEKERIAALIAARGASLSEARGEMDDHSLDNPQDCPQD